MTFIPNLVPAYHLTDDDFIGKDQPVRVRRSRDTDAFNHTQIEYVNRFNQYNTETVEAKDQANIEMFGLRTQDPVKYDFSVSRRLLVMLYSCFSSVSFMYEMNMSSILVGSTAD